MEQPRVFISYSHKDEALKEEFVTCIKALSPLGSLDVWDDRQLLPGDAFDQEILSKIANANLFFALISRYYLSSKYCRKEMYEALEKAEGQGCRVVPVIVRETPSWTAFPIGRRNAIPKDGKPLTDWSHPDRFWAEVQRGLMALLPTAPDAESPEQRPAQPDADRSEGVVGEKAGVGQGNRRGARDRAEPGGGHSAQEGFDCLDDVVFRSQLKDKIQRLLGPDKFPSLVEHFCREQGVDPATEDKAAEILVAMPPREALQRWAAVTGDLIDRQGDSTKSFWNLAESVYLALLPRLVRQEWLSHFRSQNASGNADVLQILIATPYERPNRSVEVLLGRLNRRHQVVFEKVDEQRLEQRAEPAAQIDPEKHGFHLAASPTAESVVDRLGRYLLVRYGADAPDEMKSKDWQKLDRLLVNYRQIKGKNFYLVISAKNTVFANKKVRIELFDKLPNLPRVIVADEEGSDPFDDFYDNESNITAFFALKPELQ